MKHSTTGLLFFCTLLFGACRVVKTNEPKKEDVRTAKIYREKLEREFIDAEGARLVGDTKKALKLYADFVVRYPKNSTGYYMYARLLFLHGRTGEAEAAAKKACNLDPSNIYFREFYTQTLVYQNKQKEADQQFDQLLNSRPSNSEYLYKKAMLNLKNKLFDKSIALLNQYEKLEGFSEEVTSHKKNIYLRQKKYNEAVEQIRLLQQYDKHNVEYPLMLAELFDEIGNTDSVNAVYKDIEVNYKNEPLAQVAMAQYFLEKKDKSKYHYFMEEVMKNKNLSVETKIALILPSLRNIDTDSSIAERDRLVGLAKTIYMESTENKEAILLYGDVLYYTNKTKEALPIYKEYLRYDTSTLKPFLQIIGISFDDRQYDSTIHYAKECMRNHSTSALPYFYSGISYNFQKKYDSSIQYLSRSLSLSDKKEALHSQILSSLGDVYNSTKQYTLSDSMFNQALALNKNDASVLNNYAYYLSLRKERLEDAKEMSKRSLDLQPNSKSFLDTYGWILYEMNNYEEAKEYIEKAIEAPGENDATILEHLGDVYARLDNKEKAVYYWKEAKKLDHSNPSLAKKINTQRIDD